MRKVACLGPTGTFGIPHSTFRLGTDMLYDISPSIDATLQVWPGDSPVSREVLFDMSRGDDLTLSTIRATVHLGAHADASSHYGAGAPSIEQQPLEAYLGPCRVVHVAVARGRRVMPDDLPDAIDTERLLISTGTYPDPTHFNEDFAALAPETVDWCHERGVGLIGVDTPSVDLFSDEQLLSHNRFLAHDMAILEGLVLRGVPAGQYELIALPLKLVGFDASPVRAVLRSWGDGGAGVQSKRGRPPT